MVAIGTHNGAFHADEALAVYMLRLLPEYTDAEVIRTRDEDKLASCDVVVDVGGVYDPTKLRFDHHQREFTDTYDANHVTTKLSSAGLVFRHFGRRVMAEILKRADPVPLLAEKDIDILLLKVYERFVEPIDAIDNGVDLLPAEIKTTYNSHALSITTWVAQCNPQWNQTDKESDEAQDKRFTKASHLIGEFFESTVQVLGASWLPARIVVENAIKERKHPQVIELKQTLLWREHILELEKEMNIEKPILYVVYADRGSWRVQAVPESLGSFGSRKALPEEWRGLRDAELSKIVGISDAVFVHPSGFIGGAKSYESVWTMVNAALNHSCNELESLTPNGKSSISDDAPVNNDSKRLKR